jgi:hypothetical protein
LREWAVSRRTHTNQHDPRRHGVRKVVKADDRECHQPHDDVDESRADENLQRLSELTGEIVQATSIMLYIVIVSDASTLANFWRQRPPREA